MLIGRTLLSRYKITKSLGSGGFGDTYQAVDIALPNNPTLAFGKTVGWHNGSSWLSSYDLNYELEDAPEGYFPSVSRAGDLSQGWTGYFLITPSSEKSRCLDLKSTQYP